MAEELKTIGIRLAIRREGKNVNAYLAYQNTMVGSILLGSLDLGIAEKVDFFDRWKTLMSDALAYAVEQMFGERPAMTENPAPEHERAGQA